MAVKQINKICRLGHQFFKSSDCPTCPVCEAARKPANSFISLLVAPARRALENEGIQTLKDLAKCSEKDILKLHGIGPSTIPVLKKALREMKMSFRS